MKLGTGSLLIAISTAAVLAACGSDSKNNNSSAGGQGGSSAEGGTGATAGTAGDGGTAGSGADGGTAGAGATGAMGGAAGSGAAGAGGAGAAGAGGTTGGVGGTGGTAGTGGAGGIASQRPFTSYPTVSYPTENPQDDLKELLGKVLFWEEQISSNDEVACGTCHRAEAGGSDPRLLEPGAVHPGPDGMASTPDDRRGAQGVARCDSAGQPKMDPTFGLAVQVTKRKPPSYLDAMFAGSIFWDGRATSNFIDPDNGQTAIAIGGALESQAVGPPLSDAEMSCEGRTWADIHAKLASVDPLAFATDVPPDMKDFLSDNPTYPLAFEAVYGTQEINTKRIAFAIATHERRLTSNQTPWDAWNAGDDSAMTAAQVRGFEVFMSDKAKCSTCHLPPLFTDDSFHNLGFIPYDGAFDAGRNEFTGMDLDQGKVKTPGLRNVGLRESTSGGLLHNGAGPGADLEAVMEAYNNPPMHAPPGCADCIHPALQAPLGLTQQEIDDIIDFMRNALTDPRVQAASSPFDRPKLGTEQ